jgi:hypothetical protein
MLIRMLWLPQDQADQPIRAMAINGITGMARHIMLLFRISEFSVE